MSTLTLPSQSLSAGVSPQDAWRLLPRAAGPALWDTCPPDDRAALPRRVPGSDLISHKDDLAPSGSATLVICTKGGKLSQGVAARLRAAGTPAAHIIGGLVGWVEAGLPTTELVPDISLLVAPNDSFANAALTRWFITRLAPPGSELMTVPSAVLADTADRFAAQIMAQPEAVLDWLDCQATDLRALLDPGPLHTVLRGIERLHGADEAGQRACFDLFDAALAGAAQ